MVWPESVLTQFKLIPDNADEDDFHGPYNKLLYYLFPFDSPFTVIPQFLKPGSSIPAEYIVSFEVFLLNRPVLILELKPPADMNYNSARQLADEQIRRRLGDLGDECPIPTLNAISAIGTRLCFYSMDTRNTEPEIVPLGIPCHATRMTDTAPVARWDCDVLDAVGEARLRAVVDQIKEACANIA